MNAMTLTRRTLLKGGLTLGAGLVIGFYTLLVLVFTWYF